MAIYTVHEPPMRDDDALAHAERFVFVRDGFSFWAFLFGPLWMLRRRLWLAFILYIVVVTAIMIGLSVIGTSTGVKLFALLMLALLVGFEAASLRRWKVSRRGWTNLGVVVGDDLETAERRFFDGWVHGTTNPAGPPAPAPARMTSAAGPDVIGLFPEPGARS